MNKVTVFCGSRCGEQDRYAGMARKMGDLLAKNDFICVNGGGAGMMEELSKGAIEAGGDVSIVALDGGFHVHDYFTEKDVIEGLVPRQQKLIEVGDFFIALPGGIGTLFEVLEIASRIGLQELDRERPVICVGTYFEPFQRALHHVESEGFAWTAVEQHVRFVPTPEAAIDMLVRMRNEYAAK